MPTGSKWSISTIFSWRWSRLSGICRRPQARPLGGRPRPAANASADRRLAAQCRPAAATSTVHFDLVKPDRRRYAERRDGDDITAAEGDAAARAEAVRATPDQAVTHL